MLKFLKRIFGKKTPKPETPKDLWAGGRESYVNVFFRKRLDQLARDLSGLFGEMKTRYNPERGCAEVYMTKTGLVIFQVVVNGTMGSPYEALVTAVALQTSMKLMIWAIFDDKIRVKWNFLFEVQEPART